MATHSSILSWEIPWAEKPGGLESMGCKVLNTTQRPQNNKHVRDTDFSACVEGRKGLILAVYLLQVQISGYAQQQLPNSSLAVSFYLFFWGESYVLECQTLFLCCTLLPLYLGYFCPEGTSSAYFFVRWWLHLVYEAPKSILWRQLA